MVFTERCWADYLHWQQTDKAKLKRIHQLIADVSGRLNPALASLSPSSIGFRDSGPGELMRSIAWFTLSGDCAARLFRL